MLIFISSICTMIKQYLSLFILKYILGWQIEINRYKTPHILAPTERNVVIYIHTSIYDLIIGYLVAMAYDIPLTGATVGDADIPYINTLIQKLGFMIIDKKKDMNTVRYIAKQLNEKTNFCFSIMPLSIDQLKPGFFHIATETKSDLWFSHINFESQTFTTKLISRYSDLVDYDKIKTLVEAEIKQEKPYICYKYNIIENNNYKPSLINISRSIIVYIPPLIVMMILIRVCLAIYTSI